MTRLTVVRVSDTAPSRHHFRSNFTNLAVISFAHHLTFLGTRSQYRAVLVIKQICTLPPTRFVYHESLQARHPRHPHRFQKNIIGKLSHVFVRFTIFTLPGNKEPIMDHARLKVWTNTTDIPASPRWSRREVGKEALRHLDWKPYRLDSAVLSDLNGSAIFLGYNIVGVFAPPTSHRFHRSGQEQFVLVPEIENFNRNIWISALHPSFPFRTRP